MTPADIESIFDVLESGSDDLPKSIWSMFSQLGNERLLEWEPRVRALLTHHDPMIVAEAITVLGSRWRRPDFDKECLTFFNDEERDIRVAAQFALTVYGLGTGDYALAQLFLGRLQDKTKPYRERCQAITAIPRVLEGNKIEQVELRKTADALMSFRGTEEEFVEQVPWGSLKEIMDRHA